MSALAFNPNNLVDSGHLWGTYRPAYYGKCRTPWKTHETIRQVRSAVDRADMIEVWHRETTESPWSKIVVFDWGNGIPIHGPQDRCFVCGEQMDWRNMAWHPDHIFAKVMVHYHCQRKLSKRRITGDETLVDVSS